MACFLGILISLFEVPLSMASLINATVGLSVLLPCIIPPPPPPLMNTLIYWQTVERDVRDTPLMLLCYDKGKEVHDFTDEKYKNRTALDFSELPSGNFSLELKNVTKEDNQTTVRCLYFRGFQSPQEVSRIILQVLDKPDEPDPHPVSFPVWAAGLLIAVALLLLVSCVAEVVCKARRKKTGHAAMRDVDR